MNPLTRALKLAEDPRPGTAARPSDPAVGVPEAPGPVLATGDAPGSETHSPAATAFGDARGPEAADAARPPPMRVTGDGTDSETPPPAAPAVGDGCAPRNRDPAPLAPLRATGDGVSSEPLPPLALAVGDPLVPRTPDPAPLAPLRATNDRPDADTANPADDFVAPDSPAPARAVQGGALSDTAGAPANGAGAARACRLEGFRSLPRGRGVGRGIGIALSMLAAAGAAAGGGTFLWKTELARPALVGSLPPLPELTPEPTAAPAAGAAVSESGEPAGRADPPSEAPPTVVAAAPGSASPRAIRTAAPGSAGPRATSAAAPGSGIPSRISGVAVSTGSLPGPAAAPRRAGLPALPAAAPGDAGLPAPPAAAPGAAGLPAPPAAAPAREGFPTGPKADSGDSASRAVSAAPVPESASDGSPAAGASGETRGIAAGHDATVAAPYDDAAPRPGAGARIAITKRTRADHVAESLRRAYEAYLAGAGEAAAQAYQSVLRHEPRNRDALLGLAGLAAQADRWGEAAEHYATVLAFHPADTAARAALIAVGEKDPARAESRLKALLRIEPEAAHLHFRLGNLYAAESRWPEAQQAWFRAYRLDRDNADHAYNLAVSLDHLSQSRSALDLYREALVLARSTRASFEPGAVRDRVRALESRPHAEHAPDGMPPGATAAAAHVR